MPKNTFKRIWGRWVFRYAGRNIVSHSISTSRKFYNIIGHCYDWLYADHIYGYREATAWMIDHYVSPGESVLDLGCGTGLLIEYAKSKTSHIVGVDIAYNMVHHAKEKFSGSGHIDFVVADCRYLPVRERFDKVVSSFMLVILPKPERIEVVRQLRSYLTNQGALVFLTAQDWLSHEWFTRDEWTDCARQAGFSRVHIHDLLDYYRIVWIGEQLPPEV